MQAIIKTENQTLFEGLIHFLKSLQISVETIEKKQVRILNKNGEKVDAMRKLRGSGNGKLISALLEERAKDKNTKQKFLFL